MIFRLSLAVCTVALLAFPVQAATPDFSKCDKLSDESAYKDKYEDFMFMVPGKDGWFFRTKQDMTSDFKVSDKGIEKFKRLSALLKSKGTELVIAFPPTRGIAAAKFLPDNNALLKGYDPAVATRNYANLIATMNKNGVQMVGTPDVKAGGDYFYKLDMHWTTAGAKEMAEAVAAHIKTMPVYKDLRKTEFVTKREKDGINEGHFNKPLQGLCGEKLPDEVAVQERTSVKDSGHDSKALFGDKGVPEVVLVGTSNSNRDDFDLNFSGALKQSLSADVYNAAIAGGGIDDALLAYLASDMYKKSPAKVIIWEIPSYYNLNGEVMMYSLKQAIPATYGMCATAIAEAGPVALGTSEQKLLTGLDTKQITAGQYYLALDFDKAIRKKFTVNFQYADEGEKKVKFRDSRNPDKKSAFYAPDAKEVRTLKAVTIDPGKDMDGVKVTAKICALPE